MSVQVRWSYLLFYIFALVLNFRAFGQAEIAKPSPTSEDSFNIHVDVDLVTADITVTGAATPEFRAEDFVIYDNNLAQPITYFSHDQLPIAIALLIDSSYSIANHLNELQIAALTALGRLKAEDQVALFSFAERVSRLSDVTEDRLQIAKLVSHLTITPGATNIQAALLNASRYLRKVASRRRRAIILIDQLLMAKEVPKTAIAKPYRKVNAGKTAEVHATANPPTGQVTNEATITVGRTILLDSPGSAELIPRSRLLRFQAHQDCGFCFGVVCLHTSGRRPPVMAW